MIKASIIGALIIIPLYIFLAWMWYGYMTKNHPEPPTPPHALEKIDFQERENDPQLLVPQGMETDKWY